MHLAVVGKGGAGKSVISGSLARLLAANGRKVLALDSDPMPGLALSLGMGALEAAFLSDVVEKEEHGRWKLKKGIGAVRAVQRCSVEGPDGIRLLQFGKVGAAGMDPIMGSVNGFYQVVHRLSESRSLKEWDIIGDLPAGPRQAAFNWAPYAESFLVVVDPSWKSMLTARRTARIVRAAGARAVLIANKIASPADVAAIEATLKERVYGSIPLAPEVVEAERRGRAVVDLAPHGKIVRALEELLDRLDSGATEVVQA